MVDKHFIPTKLTNFVPIVNELSIAQSSIAPIGAIDMNIIFLCQCIESLTTDKSVGVSSVHLQRAY